MCHPSICPNPHEPLLATISDLIEQFKAPQICPDAALMCEVEVTESLLLLHADRNNLPKSRVIKQQAHEAD